MSLSIGYGRIVGLERVRWTVRVETPSTSAETSRDLLNATGDRVSFRLGTTHDEIAHRLVSGLPLWPDRANLIRRAPGRPSSTALYATELRLQLRVDAIKAG